ncbi:transporter [Fulvitalea axinellae]|uniref:Transporter n=1 Tax=Fulvitalea axinellae TaxID=1182444 RepID=A0AAU9CWB9_9BACT|nr:transporter [Fulvitalea axinellae]
MWNKLAHSVLKHRLYWIIALGIMTVFMAQYAMKVEMSYDFGGTVPKDDPEMVFFSQFKDKFGEDGNILAVGLEDKSVYTPDKFRKLAYLGDELARIKGVNNVLSLPRVLKLTKNAKEKRFEAKQIFNPLPDNQEQLDSLLKVAKGQKLYAGQIFNPKNGATFLLLSIQKEYLNSAKRFALMDDITRAGDQFSEETGIQLRYAGLPFIRAVVSTKVKAELQMFLVLSLMVTALILWVFFRSWDAVAVPMILIFIIVIWSTGTLGLFGFKVTMLTGLIPPIIVVIGIPNSVYLLNKYHQETAKHGNKARALSVVIRKVGVVTLITNFTTAAGFIVLGFTQITLLKEFGIVAGINVLATFMVSIIFIPAVFSYLPTPHGKRLKHLDSKLQTRLLDMIDLQVHRHPRRIFLFSGILVSVALFGVTKMKAISYMVDDIPEDSQIKRDLRFFESNIGGVMPLQFVVDTGKPRGVMKLSTLKKVNELETFLAAQPEISQPISITTLIKASTQAYYNGNPKYYRLPNSREKNFILRYLDNQDDSSGLIKSFVDSTGQIMRINCMVADVGSKKLGELIQDRIQPEIDKVFGKDGKITVRPTGTTLLFVKGNNFLIDNLITSMLLAFLIVAILMALLFQRLRIIVISLIPNMIPLILTAGMMGYFGIPLKPSTALIFSITFGIAVDDSIHFLAKYRQELFANRFFVPVAISKTLKETGSSMIYTSIVLFFGFVIFAFSEFGGTKALGLLTSITLLMAMLTNLVVLPALLMVFDNGKRKKGDGLVEHFEEFYHEDDDEEIDLGQLDLGEKG